MVVSQLYETFHKTTTQQNKVIKENNFTYKTIIQTINKYVRKGDVLLDIGCGAGTLSLYYAHKGFTVKGIDISQKAVDAANESAKQLRLNNVRFNKIDFPNETPKEKYDFIIFTEVIEHLKNDSLALEKIFDLLNPKGIVLITTPSKNAPLYQLGLATEFDKSVGHLRRYTIDELSIKCKNAGFKILETKRTEGILRNFLYLNSTAGKLIRFIRFFLVDVVLFIDRLLVIPFGESNIFLIVQKP